MSKKHKALKKIYKLTKGNIHAFATPDAIMKECKYCDRNYLYQLENEGMLLKTYHPDEEGYTLSPMGEEYLTEHKKQTFMNWINALGFLAALGALYFSALPYF